MNTIISCKIHSEIIILNIHIFFIKSNTTKEPTTTTTDPLNILNVDEEWLEAQVYNGYRIWHILFFIMTVFFTFGTFSISAQSLNYLIYQTSYSGVNVLLCTISDSPNQTRNRSWFCTSKDHDEILQTIKITEWYWNGQHGPVKRY